MITVDVAYRISTLADYSVANACLMSLIVAAGAAWFYLQHTAKKI
jgi:hypothetical protein